MTTPGDPEWILRMDEGDPAQAEMITYLRAIRRRGRYSPVPRILARWATIGYLFESGRVPMPRGDAPSAGPAAPAADALAAVQREIAAIEEGASAFIFE